jgi:dihydroorotase
MPNTNPPYDHASVVRQLRQTAMYEGCVHVEVIGAITVGRQGQTLTDMTELVEAGCIAFSDDGDPVSDPHMMRSAMQYASMLGVPIMSHCEERRLNRGWAMHEGAVSVRLGLPGYPSAAEESQIARDIALAEETGAHLHICHVSTAGGVALIRTAKERGIRVTAEVTPHHLTLTHEWVLGHLLTTTQLSNHAAVSHAVGQSSRHSGFDPDLQRPLWLDPTLLPPYDTSTRVSPPLRTEEDINALLTGLADNTIDAIATDHAPHATADKAREYGLAACGISGLETALGLVLTLVHCGKMDLMGVIAKLTEGPAQVLGRAPASLRPGARADVVIIDPEATWNVDRSLFASQGKNTPLRGQMLKGRVVFTMSGGDVVFQREDFGRNQQGGPQASRLEGILPGDD